MKNNRPASFQRALQGIVRRLLGLRPLHVAAVFVAAAIVFSMLIVLVIDFSWDGRFNAELEFAGVVTPFLDALLIVGVLTALLQALHEEIARRSQAEADIRRMNEELEKIVQERTGQLLEAQAELLRREKLALLGQVADTVGHELRNPLGVMNNAVYYLQAVLPETDETVQEYLGIIKDEILSTERIVSDLLDAVRTKPPHPASIEIAEILGQTLRKCKIPPSVTVALDLPATLSGIRADPMHLHQILWNLITNAVEAMPQGGALAIRAQEDETAHAVCISVEDNGIGIAPEQQATLFQPLYTTKPRRIGLGLVVVKNLAQINGGSVAVESAPGAGSTFTLTLPSGD